MTKRKLLGITGIVFFCITCCFFILLSIGVAVELCCQLTDTYARARKSIGLVLSLLALASIVIGLVWNLKKRQLSLAPWSLALWTICIAYCFSVVSFFMSFGGPSAVAIYLIVATPLLVICFFSLRSSWKRTADDNMSRSSLKHMLLLFAVGGITLGISLGISLVIQTEIALRGILDGIDWDAFAEVLEIFLGKLREGAQ